MLQTAQLSTAHAGGGPEEADVEHLNTGQELQQGVIAVRQEA